MHTFFCKQLRMLVSTCVFIRNFCQTIVPIVSLFKMKTSPLKQKDFLNLGRINYHVVSNTVADMFTFAFILMDYKKDMFLDI